MGLIGAQGIGITPPSPRTFAYGEQGTIEMKPMDVVSQSTLAPGGPQQTQPTQEPISTIPDPYKMWELEQKRNLDQVEKVYQMGVIETTKKTQFKLQSLNEEYAIKKESLEKEMQMAGPEQKEKYNARFLALDTQYAIATKRLQNKDNPDLFELDSKKQQIVAQIQEEATKKKIALDTIKRLVDTGVITDPKVGLHEQLQVVGVDISLSEMRPPDPRQQLAELNYYIRLIEDQADVTKDVTKFVKTLLSPEQQAQLDELKAKRNKILVQLNPEVASIVNRPKLSTANRDIMENKGGTIGTMMEKEMPLRSRGTGTITPMTKQTPKYASNPTTGQRIVSYDEGKSWQIVQ